MSFLLKWLGLGKAASGVGLRPHRDVELDLGYDAAYDKTLEAIELALGAYVSIDDRRGGLLEAAFGLVNNERIRCTFTRSGEARTSVRIEAFFPANAEVPKTSRAVDAMAEMLSRSA